jgi:hypothetical protein
VAILSWRDRRYDRRSSHPGRLRYPNSRHSEERSDEESAVAGQARKQSYSVSPNAEIENQRLRHPPARFQSLSQLFAKQS